MILRHWGELTYRELADVLGCPIRTAQSRVRLAHKKLQAGLARRQVIGLGDLEREIGP